MPDLDIDNPRVALTVASGLRGEPGPQGPTGSPPFMVTTTTNAAPPGAVVGDFIVNASTAAITIGNLTNRAIGDVVRITALDPFTVVAAGNIRGAQGIPGPQGDVGRSGTSTTKAVRFPAGAGGTNFVQTPGVPILQQMDSGYDIRWCARARANPGSVIERVWGMTQGQAFTFSQSVGVLAPITLNIVGSGGNLYNAAPGSGTFTEGDWYTIRYTWNAAGGTGSILCYRSYDGGATWTEVGIGTATAGQIITNPAFTNLRLGGAGGTSLNAPMDMAWVEIRRFDTGALIARCDFQDPEAWVGNTYTDDAGKVWTITPRPQNSGTSSALWFPGAAGDTVETTTPASAITSQLGAGLDVRWRAQRPATAQRLFGNALNGGFTLTLSASASVPSLQVHDGTTAIVSVSMGAHADWGQGIGDWQCGRITYDATGGPASVVAYLSDDNGATWNQVATASGSAGSINPNPSSPVRVNPGPANFFNAAVAWVEVRKLDGTLVAACDFQDAWGGGQYRDAAANTWTINGTGTRWTRATWRTPATVPEWQWVPGPTTGPAVGPRGEKGDTGDVGPAGPVGNPPFVVTANTTTAPVGARVGDSIINSGTGPVTIGNQTNRQIGDAVRITQLSPLQGTPAGNIRGPEGPGGPAGQQGDVATVSVGVVDTSPPGGDAEVVNSSANPGAAVLDFTLPRGDAGPQGELGLFTVTANTPNPPTGATVGASIVNTGSVQVSIANTAVDPGDVVRITSLSPFAVTAAGSLRGPPGEITNLAKPVMRTAALANMNIGTAENAWGGGITFGGDLTSGVTYGVWVVATGDFAVNANVTAYLNLRIGLAGTGISGWNYSKTVRQFIANQFDNQAITAQHVLVRDWQGDPDARTSALLRAEINTVNCRNGTLTMIALPV